MAKFSIQPKSGLLEEVCSNIHKKERSFYVKRIILFSVILFVCAFVFVPTLKMLVTDIKASGFLYFVYLLFSDTSIIVSYWKSFVMALAESLPAISLAFFLFLVLGIMQSVKYLVRDINYVSKIKA